MKQELEILTKKLHQLQGQRDLLIQQQTEAERNAGVYQQTYINTLKAREIVSMVAQNTQKAIEIHISSLVTMALSSVFPDPYEFQLRFVQRRNKTEADLIFLKKENEVDDILENGGGGVADVASFALRIALWSLKKTRPTILLDEPMKFLHNPVYQEKISDVLKEISGRLGIQIIMVSDQQALLKSADKVIEIINIDGISLIKDDKISISPTIKNTASNEGYARILIPKENPNPSRKLARRK